jgi:PTH2 family peptidyl-tRNA hydrolase
MKQAIILRKDLKMGAGKLVAQGCHASLAASMKVDHDTREEWMSEGMKKVVLKVSSERELRELQMEAKKEKIQSELIRDAGLTQVDPGTATALGIGPAEDSKIDSITGKLKLL